LRILKNLEIGRAALGCGRAGAIAKYKTPLKLVQDYVHYENLNSRGESQQIQQIEPQNGAKTQVEDLY